jgi:phenylalanyl-tRNA synthetase beta chain
MKASLEWLKRYVDIAEGPDELARDLTMFGLNVEGIEALAPSYTGVVFGKVLECGRHPGADRLSLCAVDAGRQRPLSIVCGAPNVRAGQRVAVAVEGAVLAGGLRIKRSKIRGQLSEGMICSSVELGIGEDGGGILELDFDDAPGAILDGRLGRTDYVLEIEVTPNRPDLLSHVGVAREIAALYRRELRQPEIPSLDGGESFALEIESGEDCPRYTAAFIDEVAVGPSPGWMQKLLRAVGQSPINNIVDATNFVLLELGQPIHAFDRDALAGDAIVVRRARKGERIVTLDGVDRELDPSILVIADAERAVAVAGVMGGRDTEVRPETKRLVIESAMFDPRLVRRARQRLRLDTEASYRFEREADVGIMSAAAARVCRLIAEMSAGRAGERSAERVHDPAALAGRTVALRVAQTNRVMGTQLDADDIASLLERLSLPSRIGPDALAVTVPTFRRDVVEEIDLIEETARVYGYDNIGRDETVRCGIFSVPSPEERRNELVARHLVSRGFAEAITSSFMDPEAPTRMRWDPADERSRCVRIANPLTEAQSAMRTSLIPGLLDVLRRNTPAEAEEIRIFEIGKVFIPAPGGAGLPREDLRCTALLARQAEPLQWVQRQRRSDFFDAKGEAETLFELFGLGGSVSASETAGASGRGIRWLRGGKPFAEALALAKPVLDAFDVEGPVFCFDLLVGELPAGAQWPVMSPVSPYPAVKRDLCIVVDDRVRFAEIREAIAAEAHFLDSLRIFDYYRGGHLGEGKRSFTFRLSFRSPDGTLESMAVDREVQRVLATLQREFGAALRTE